MSSDPRHGGYIMLYRSFQDSAFWEERRVFSRAEAWLDILMAARWQEEPKEIQIKNVTLLCHRGEVLYSSKTWAKRWGWSESKVQRFLHSLAGDRKAKAKRPRIVLKSEGVTTRITISNYALYQSTRSGDEGQVKGKRSGDEGQAKATEEGKDTEEINNESTPAPKGKFSQELFAGFQAAHPDCERVKDCQFQKGIASFPGANVAEAVEAFARQVAGANRIPFPVREFEKYLRNSQSSAEKSIGANHWKKTRGGVNRFGLSDTDLLG